MKPTLPLDERRIYRVLRFHIIFHSSIVALVGIGIWQVTAKLEIIYRDLGLQGTFYNAVFRILGTPLTAVVGIAIALASTIALRRFSVPALFWISFAISTFLIITLATFGPFFFMALRYPATSMQP
jgi:hypothetical protein